MAESQLLLAGRVDAYNGFIVDEDHLPADIAVFDMALELSMKAWREQKLRGLWIKVPIAKSNLIPVAVKHGFGFHHAQQDYLMLTHWIADGEVNKIPDYASHYVGVGAVVVNENNEILVVLERYRDQGGRWKIPGGLVDAGEGIGEAAERETFEETGVKSEFISIMAFREKHSYLWQKSDLYFVARLRPLTSELKKEDQEIDDCKWMPLAEFYRDPNIYPTQKAIARLALADEHRSEGQIPYQGDLYAEEVPLSIKGGIPMKVWPPSSCGSSPASPPIHCLSSSKEHWRARFPWELRILT